jgi:hypothetical protein
MSPFVPDYSRFAGSPQNIINTNAKVQDEVKGLTPAGEKEKNINGVKECETCKNRTYQDGSNDPGVSFKTPTKLDPGQAASAVASHEREHVNRNAAKASAEDKEARSTVSLHTSVCPECGRPYVSGGTTTTTVTGKQKNPQEQKAQNAQKAGVPGLDVLM